MKYSPASDKYPVTHVANHIHTEELDFFRNVLSVEIYEAMKADLCEYGKLSEYDSNTTYNIGDKVIYGGCIIESLTGSNVVNPCEDDGTNWKAADKFKSECYANFWDLHLKWYLAFRIMGETLDFSTYQIGALGVLETFSDNQGVGTRSASSKAMQSVKTTISRKIDKLLGNLEYYIQSNPTCFPNLNSCTTKRTIKNRRFHFPR